MKTMRIAALAALLAGGSVGLAGPASAEPLQGPYVATVTGGDVLDVGEPAMAMGSENFRGDEQS